MANNPITRNAKELCKLADKLKENEKKFKLSPSVSDFSYHYKMIQGRCKSTRNTKDKHRKIHELDFTKEYLKEVWDSQDGICPITDWKLVLKTNKTKKEKLLPYHASVDRIDPEKGYIKGNIRFVSVMANFALNNKFDFSDLIMMAKSIWLCYIKNISA